MKLRVIRKRSPTERLCEELRGAMVEALLDAARERRKAEYDIHALRLAEVATLHALELADQHLTLSDG